MKSSRNVVTYARVSSREQEQEGYSIPAQLKLLQQYAASEGFRIVREFVDVETAKTTGRKSFGDMVGFLKRSHDCRTVLVEKTDRLYRNFRDAVTIEELEIEIHFVKEHQVLSKDSRSQVKFMQGINLLMARNYVENLREEVIKGMHAKAETGVYPGRVPIGYKNEKATRTVVLDSVKSELVRRIFELYASGNVSLLELRKSIRNEFGILINRSYLHTILRNTFYIGYFVWGGKTYKGTHETFISPALFESVRSNLNGHNKPKYRKNDIAFRGLLTCAHDDCGVTAELKKRKYVYYRCTGYRGKCDLPRFTESEISEKLASIFERIRIPDVVLSRIQNTLQSSQSQLEAKRVALHSRYEQRLSVIRKRMTQAYSDKLDGKIDEEFWMRQMHEWQSEERQVQSELESLKRSPADSALSAQRCLELANKAYFLYLTRKPAQQAELLRMVLLNCAIDGASVYPTYRKPFDMIFERAKREEWSGRADLNCRPLAPQASALPG
jgi:site-specific DNA recombinase